MALPSFLRRKDPKPSAPAAAERAGGDDGPVQQARARARRRLIGAVVLLAIGVIGFPMVFETQPRPLPGDIPIELPRRDGAVAAAPPPSPVPRHAPAVTELPAEPAAAVASAPAEAAPPPAAEPPPVAAAKVEPKPELKSEPKPEPRHEAAAKAEPPKPDGERARALLEGRADPSASAAASARFVVQVGAYTDAATLREVRAKVEKLGLKTYTQSVDTAAGTRTRVRVGPFPDKAEAERASARLKGAGLPGAVLTL